MNQYKIFQHLSGSVEAVKQGWSWPAFFLGFVWAIFKKMWEIGIGVMLGFIVLGFIIGTTATEAWAEAIINGIGFTSNLIFGVHGNGWREHHLISRGFEEKRSVLAANPESAVALFLKGERSG